MSKHQKALVTIYFLAAVGNAVLACWYIPSTFGGACLMAAAVSVIDGLEKLWNE